MQIYPPFFGVLGSLLTIIFLSIVWYWMKYNEREKGALRAAAKWTMMGTSLLLMAVWFVCGMVSYPGFALTPERTNPEAAIAIAYLAMLITLLGFALMLIGQRKAFLATRDE